MSPAFLTHSRAAASRRPLSPDPDFAYLGVEDADTYADWESVDRDHVDRLYRLIYVGVGNRPDAEDLTLEVFRTAAERYRRILELRFIEAGSIEEAVQTMDVTVCNAKVLQHRALRMAAKARDEVDE